MIRVLYVATLAALLGATASAADSKYTLSGKNTHVTFVGTKTNGKHTGGFKTLHGSATVSGNDLTTLKIEVEILTDSLYSDDAKLTGHLKSPDFFAVKDNPKASFKSTRVEKTASGYSITGDLTLLGKTKSVTFQATASAGDTLALSSEFSIDRNDWGMSYGKGKIDDKVALKVVVKAGK